MLDDKYRIERLIATGGMGAVYLGTHIKLRKRVAIKVLNPQLNSGPMIERFHREAITASQIGHEGIAQVTDIGTSSEGEPFLVMEYLDGQSLANRLHASGPLSIEDACELGSAILSPLAAAHRAGIVHRDLKPDNVFLVRQSYGEMVKLLDFGISRTQGGDSEFRLTTTGLVLGTPYYMSPEQARGDTEITPAADLYAFGVMLYEMLAGDVPIRADNYNQLMYRVMMGDFPRPRERRPDLPEPLEQIILQAMAQAPAQRPASAMELEQALLPYCRPVFRERASARMSAPGLPLMTPPPLTRSGGSGPIPAKHPSSLAIDHTLVADAGGSTSGGSAGAINPDRPSPTPTPSVIAEPRRSRAPWIIGAIVLCAGIAAAVVILGSGDTPVPVAKATPPTTLPATHPAADASVTPPGPVAQPAVLDAGEAVGSADQSPAAPQASPMTLRFAVEPASAVILVDGKRVKGTELVVAKDDAVHTLRITAPGHIAHSETIRFDETQRLVVHLKRATGPTRNGDRRKPGTDTERIDSESPY
jgi:serine/threonine protein kinase